jgi:hypothetical protein
MESYLAHGRSIGATSTILCTTGIPRLVLLVGKGLVPELHASGRCASLFVSWPQVASDCHCLGMPVITVHGLASGLVKAVNRTQLS